MAAVACQGRVTAGRFRLAELAGDEGNLGSVEKWH
jgi:hypothetical protein